MIKFTKRALILTMSALVLIGFGIASLYYESQNNKVDPRVIEARKLYKKYDQYAEVNDFAAVLHLLDSVEDVYRVYPHYRNSYEIAVLENNRAATYLTMAIHTGNKPVSLDGVNILTKDTLLQMAKAHSKNAISHYQAWLDTYGAMGQEAIRAQIKPDFFDGLAEDDAQKRRDYLDNRVEEIQTAQLENKRRLSVALTNYGIVLRHEEKYAEAITHYKDALKLWEHNLAAKNNLNILLGKPIEKRNFIQKLFPPEKDKE